MKVGAHCVNTEIMYSKSGLTHPVPHIKEALLIGEVKEQQEAHGVPEERGGQTPKPAFRAENKRKKITHTYIRLLIRIQFFKQFCSASDLS